MTTDLFETRFVDCFVVNGSTGEYSDRREWPIVVFLSEAHAIDAVAKMDAYALELGLNLKNYDGTDQAKVDAFNKRFGPSALRDVDYTGVSFYYEKAIFGG
jgi:hypothetical protein